MKTKNILIIVTLLIILGASAFWYKSTHEAVVLTQEEGTEKFSGVLEEVNTGCFADGECYVVVDQRHITLLIGWSQDTVGSIIGAPSIGDLENYIGKEVEVYAQTKDDGTYTLYGNENFYVKVK